MNAKTVGLENLPNVYIDKITLEDGSSPSTMKMTIGLKMFDHIAPNTSWRNRLEGLSVKIFVHYGDVAIDQFNQGPKSLYDYTESSEIGIVRVIPQEYFRPPSTSGAVATFTGIVSTELNNYIMFYEEVEINDIILQDNINLYAACFIDLDPTGIPQFDKFYGPMAGEKIFANGEINQFSYYFYDVLL